MSDPTSHPGAFLTLEDGHRLGKAGLDRIFKLGSLWHYGPVYENMEPIYRVVGKQAHHSGSLRDHNLAVWEDAKPDRHGNRNRSHKSNGWGGPRRVKVQEAPLTWFIEVECVSSPWAEMGKRTGLPPCAMIPRAFVQWERRTFNIKPGEAPTEPAMVLIQAEAEKRRTAFISEGGWIDAQPEVDLTATRSSTVIAGLERALRHAEDELAASQRREKIVQRANREHLRRALAAEKKLAQIRAAALA